MTLSELLRRNRSYRRFQQQPLDEDTLVELVGLTRLCPSAANRQPLKYLLALGRPGETVQLEEGSPDQRPYWRDPQGVHHIPKRPLSELRIQPPGF